MLRMAAAVGVVVACWPAGAARTTGGDPVIVLVTLRDQPAAALAEERPELEVAEALASDARDDARGRHAARLMQRAAARAERSQAGVQRHVADLGGEVLYAARAVNLVAASVPRAAIDSLRARPDVVAVEIDEPRHALLEHVAGATLANTFWAQGITGGAVDVAVIDTGVYVDHEAFAPRKASMPGAVFHRAAQTYSDYYDVPDDPDDYGGHGSLVAGMVFGQGSAAVAGRKGLAHGLDKLYNLKAGFATRSGGGANLLTDLMEAVDWALLRPDPPEVFNYSYGASATADDDVYARYWDGLVDAWGKTATVSAGNSGPNAYTLGSPGTAYNVLSVANVNSRSTISRADDAVASSSSRGPTLGGRKKPDLAAPGSSIALPSAFGAMSWLLATGTSFSAPAVAGAAALLIEAGVTDPRAVRAVLINTSDDLGAPGWDIEYGWGYYNGSRAWAERAEWRIDAYGAPGTPAGVRIFERSTPAPTRATLAWNRHVAYYPPPSLPASSGVLNDLDLRLYAADTGVLRAASTSRIDNVERVTSTASEAAVLVVQTVAPFSTASGSHETAALAHSGGFVPRSGPGIVLDLNVPGSVTPGSTFTVTALVTNPGDLRGHAYDVTLSVPTGYSVVSPGTTQTVPAIAPGQQATLTWTVTAPGASVSAQTIAVQGRTTSYGFSWSANASASIVAEVGCAYAVTPPPTLGAGGGQASVPVTAPSGCAWSATSSTAWLSVQSGAAGSGSGQVVVAATANAGSVARYATLTVAGQAVTVAQEGTPSAEPRSYYLAEGATGDFFDLDVAIANPNDSEAPVAIRFLREDGSVVTRTETVAALSRRTLHVNAIAGLQSGPVSTIVESTAGLPLVVERTMAWTGDAYGAHGGGAVDGPKRAWYFAEGSQGFFDTYLLLANPGTAAARVTVTFLRDAGGPVVRVVEVPGTSRSTLYAGLDEELRDRSFSIAVSSDEPVIAERAMYWSSGDTFWVGGHESAGVEGPAVEWSHAEGATGPYFDTYVLVGNPNPRPATLTVRYLLPSGAAITRTHEVAAHARHTIDVETEDPMLADTAVSITVRADVPVISERAMYWPGSPSSWQEAHNSFGLTATGVRWGLAEGCVGGTRRAQTYVLLANATSSAASVTVTFLPESGPPVVRTFSVPATSRFNVDVGAQAPGLAGTCFGALIESTNGVPIAVERAVYWDARGLRWAAGTNVTAVPLP